MRGLWRPPQWKWFPCRTLHIWYGEVRLGRCGELVADEKWVIRKHLERCPECHEETAAEVAWSVEQVGREKSHALGIEEAPE